jgi:SAM-dependent methyltransferase
MISHAPEFEQYCKAIAKMGNRPGNLGFYLGYLFDGIDLRGKRMLDVGAGDGRFCFYAACAGATEVVGLEPDADGSSSAHNMTGTAFERMSQMVDKPNVRLVRDTLQDYRRDGELFDVVLLHAAVNHLDEDACTRLHEDEAAREAYGEIFDKVAQLMKPGGTLIVVDAARRNFFGDLKLTNPVARTIEWHKHQSPQLWTKLLQRSGFVAPRVRWSTLNSLRAAGRLLLGNRVAAYFMASGFVLTMQRDPAAVETPRAATGRFKRTPVAERETVAR